MHPVQQALVVPPTPSIREGRARPCDERVTHVGGKGGLLYHRLGRVNGDQGSQIEDRREFLRRYRE